MPEHNSVVEALQQFLDLLKSSTNYNNTTTTDVRCQQSNDHVVGHQDSCHPYKIVLCEELPMESPADEKRNKNKKEKTLRTSGRVPKINLPGKSVLSC